MTEPNWIITAAVGAVLGKFVNDYGALLLYPIRRFKKDQYTSEWYEYHWSFRGNKKTLCPAKLVIRHGLLVPYAVRFSHVSSTGTPSVLQYKGTMRLEERDVVIELSAITHTETLTYRFPKWIPSASDRLVGLWMSFDHTGAPAAGGTLLSRTSLTDLEASKYLHDGLAGSDGFLRVNPSFDTQDETASK